MELLDEIRAATRLQHKSLEGEWDLVPGLLRVQDRCTILRALYQVHAPSELALLPWLTGLPDLGYRQRLKAPLLRADLKDLGASEPDLIWLAEQLPQIQNSAWALGFTYVLEGSTLGGQVIRKAVVAAAASLVGLSFFGVYGRDTGSRWKQFCHVLERECRTRREDCARGAVAGFDFVSTIFQSSLDRTRPARLTER